MFCVSNLIINLRPINVTKPCLFLCLFEIICWKSNGHKLPFSHSIQNSPGQSKGNVKVQECVLGKLYQTPGGEALFFKKKEFLRELALHTSYGERWLRKNPQIFQRRRLWLCYGLLEAEDIPFCPPLCHKHFVPPSNMIPLILDDFDGEYLASYSTKNDSRKLRQFKPQPLLTFIPKNSRNHGLLIRRAYKFNWCE